ncbi:MAG TPA: hypothetical protein VHO94_06365 [Oscillospiraceae bacterium]|nr:hypothetical protein [Oscillospiraceae bacterium]
MPRLLYNTKQKLYPNGYVKQVSCSYAVFALNKFGEEKELKDDEREEKIQKLREVYKGLTYEDALQLMNEENSKPKNMSNDTREDSVKRAKEKIFDIAVLNEFDHFITWTLDGEKIDRCNPKEVSKKLRVFLQHMVQRKHCRYLIIPELHKDGKGIHMHGFASGDLEYVDSGHIDNQGHTIYNMPQWSLGWSTAIELYGSRLHTACYITKYVSKDFKKIFGNFYYAGGGVERNVPTEYKQLDYESINAKEFSNVYRYKYVGYDSADSQAMENTQNILKALGEFNE